jgi:hypothetical protein
MAHDAQSTEMIADLIGTRSRVAGTGQEYEVVGKLDANTALVQVETWDEPLPYAVKQIELDLAGVCEKARFQSLVGDYRTIGPDGPPYQVVAIIDGETAKIWVVAEDDTETYRIENILLDPIAVD